MNKESDNMKSRAVEKLVSDGYVLINPTYKYNSFSNKSYAVLGKKEAGLNQYHLVYIDLDTDKVALFKNYSDDEVENIILMSKIIKEK